MRGQIGIIVHGLPATLENTDVLTMLASWPFHEAIKKVQFYGDTQLYDVLVYFPRDLRVIDPIPTEPLNLWVEIQSTMGGVRAEVLAQMVTKVLEELKKWAADCKDILPLVSSITVVIPSRDIHALWPDG